MSNKAPLVFWRDAFILEVLHGPLSLRIRAHSDGATDSSSAEEAAKAALGALEELAPLRRMLATPAWRLRPSPGWPRVLRLMVDAALQTGDHTLTPMAAVAGSIAQVALEAGMHVGVGTMVVENGGDIALVVAPGDSVRIGVAESIGRRRPTHVVTIDSSSGIGGICTSGLGGRSFTRGVAEAAVAVSHTAALADACATVIGNATYVAHPAVEQRRARDLDPATDIPDLLVTTRVGSLPDDVVSRSLEQAVSVARQLIVGGTIQGAVVRVCGRAVLLPPKIAEPVT